MEKDELTLDEAMDIIKEYGREYNRVTVYKRCYVFYYDDESGVIMDGGYGAPIAVTKESREIKNLIELVNDGILARSEIVKEGLIIDLVK